MLFHLGVLWRLNESGWLPRLDRISSVSGGSITAAVLALAWTRLGFDAGRVAREFESLVVSPLRHLAGQPVGRAAVVASALLPGVTAADRVGAALRRHLFSRATLQDLPDRPRFAFNATNLVSGTLVCFSKPYAADWRVGRIERPDFDLGSVVACSSAPPPLLSPYRLSLKGRTWTTEDGNDLTEPAYRERWLLSDGGLYDNLGVATAWKQCRTLIVSDAGGRLDADPRPGNAWPRRLLRTLGVVEGQARALNASQVVSGFRRGERQGFYVELGGDLAHVSTRLAPLEPRLQERLINRGYATCDAGLRERLDPSPGPPHKCPYPEGT